MNRIPIKSALLLANTRKTNSILKLLPAFARAEPHALNVKVSDASKPKRSFFFLRHNPHYRRLTRSLDRGIRKALYATLDRVVPAPVPGDIPKTEDIKRILFVRANFRIGNVILATALLPLLRARFPHASIDVLVGDKAALLLSGQPLRDLHLVSRRFIYAPWGFFTLFHKLRRERFDLAVDGGMGSFSGALFSWLSGARYRIGVDGRHNRFLTTRLHLPNCTNVYDHIKSVGQALGAKVHAWPSYHVSPEESQQALTWLERIGFAEDGEVRPFLGVFVGGNMEKRWPRKCWLELIDQLKENGVATLVFVGPNETDMAASLQTKAGITVHIMPPQCLRTFGSLLARTTLLLTPDSGAMHLAAAVGVPLIAIIQKDHSRFYVPRGKSNSVLIRPEVGTVMRALQRHPDWERFRYDVSEGFLEKVVISGPDM